jgi:hypothetical protein
MAKALSVSNNHDALNRRLTASHSSIDAEKKWESSPALGNP